PVAEVLLFQAARAQHVAELIEPTLARGVNVLTDRYVFSTYAYQARAGGLLPLATTMRPELMVVPPIDHLIVLDCDAATAAQRLRIADRAPDRIERNSPEYFERAREAFKEACGLCESSILIDATQAP